MKKFIRYIDKDKLPEQIATHWGVNGEANGFSNRIFAVFELPIFMFVVHWLCVLVTAADSKNKGQNKKAISMVLWIVPVLSVYTSAIIYCTAFGMKFDRDILMLILLGLMFIIIGNYLPKCKQNHTIGIKVHWTLRDEENWNATHRFCGKLWVIGGLLFMLCAFLPTSVIPYILIVLVVVLAIIPILYSYTYYKKKK